MLFCSEEPECRFSKFQRRRRLESDLKFVDFILQQTKNEIFFLKVNLWRTKKKGIDNKPDRISSREKKLFFRSLKIVIYFVTQLSFVEQEKIDYHFHCLILKTCYFIKKKEKRTLSQYSNNPCFPKLKFLQPFFVQKV